MDWQHHCYSSLDQGMLPSSNAKLCCKALDAKFCNSEHNNDIFQAKVQMSWFTLRLNFWGALVLMRFECWADDGTKSSKAGSTKKSYIRRLYAKIFGHGIRSSRVMSRSAMAPMTTGPSIPEPTSSKTVVAEINPTTSFLSWLFPWSCRGEIVMIMSDCWSLSIEVSRADWLLKWCLKGRFAVNKFCGQLAKSLATRESQSLLRVQ